MKTIELPETLDIHATQALYDTLDTYVGQDVTLDGTRLKFFGTAAQQLVIVAQNTWAMSGKSFELENLGPDAVEDTRISDLAQFIFKQNAS